MASFKSFFSGQVFFNRLQKESNELLLFLKKIITKRLKYKSLWDPLKNDTKTGKFYGDNSIYMSSLCPSFIPWLIACLLTGIFNFYF